MRRRETKKIVIVAFIVISLTAILLLTEGEAPKAQMSVKELIKNKKYDELIKEGKYAVPYLIPALRNDDTTVRGDIIDTLAGIGKPAVELLIESLDDDRNYQRWDVMLALSKIGKPAVAPLKAVLKFKNPRVLKYAVIALGNIGDKSAIKQITGLLDYKDIRVRRHSAWALGKIGDKSSTDALTAALKDEDAIVREAAATALGAINDPKAVDTLIPVLGDPDVMVRTAAVTSLGMLKDEKAIGALIASLKDEDIVQSNAVRALVNIGKGSIDSLVESIKDEKAAVRRRTAMALGRLGGDRAKAILLKLLDSKEETSREVRKTAACSAGDLKAVDAVDDLIRMLTEDKQHYRFCAAYALTRIGAPAVEKLIDTAKLDAEGKVPAIDVLGAIGDKSATDTLISLLDNQKSWEVKKAVLVAFQRINDSKAIDASLSQMNGIDENVRYFAAQALSTLGWQPQGEKEELNFNIAALNWPELVNMKKAAVTKLITMLTGNSAYFTRNAVVTLGEIGDESAVASLIPLLEEEENALDVTALGALKMITKEDFGQDKEKWESWWESKK